MKIVQEKNASFTVYSSLEKEKKANERFVTLPIFLRVPLVMHI